KVQTVDAKNEMAEHYLAELEAGTLHKNQVSYRSQMPQEVEESEGKHDYHARMTHLMLLYTRRDPEGASILQTYCKRKDEPLLV
ncbi:hypothetical protein R0J91_19540, partial [Micrococcus sp. SIMBA_131]